MDIYLLRNDIKLGPYSEAKIRDLLNTGLAKDEDLGWHEGLTGWVSLRLITGSQPTDVPISPSQLVASKSVFRVIVVLSFMCLVAQIACAYAQPLPESLATFVNQPGNSGSIFAGITAVIYFSALLVAYAGLFLLKTWGRVVFAFTVVWGLVVGLTQGPLVEPSSAELFGCLSDLFTGAVLAMAFLTPILQSQAQGRN